MVTSIFSVKEENPDPGLRNPIGCRGKSWTRWKWRVAATVEGSNLKEVKKEVVWYKRL